MAQTDSALTIRVESKQVLVPAFVFDNRQWGVPYTAAGIRCQEDSAKTLQEKGISVRQTPMKCLPGVVLALAPKDFRLLEDGIEQPVQSVGRGHLHWWQLFDDYGDHSEYAGTPASKWSTADETKDPDWYWSPPGVESYILAYEPPRSPKGSCHQINVSVDRRNVTVYSRTEYCNVEHSPSDPLEGTTFAQEMESDLASAERPKISLIAASGLFFGDSGGMRVHLVLEFPWNSLDRGWRNGGPSATIGALGVAYRKDGIVAARFSDQACCGTPGIPLGNYGDLAVDSDSVAVFNMPARYETQVDLPAGQYDLRFILSDGKKFGRVDLPLSVDNYQDAPLALSSVALCKRFHKVDPPEYTEGILPSKFFPLVSKGVEFTPTADPTFEKNRDPLFAYFEIYAPKQVGAAAGATNAPNPTSAAGEAFAPSNARAALAGETIAPKSPAEPQLPPGANATVHFQLKIANLKSGQVQIDSGLRPATEFLQAGKAVIPIVQEISTHDLPKGNYRLEVQATDSHGNRTPWHAAAFTLR